MAIIKDENNPNLEIITGEDLPKKLRDYGITTMSVRAGTRITEEQADGLIEELKQQNVISEN